MSLMQILLVLFLVLAVVVKVTERFGKPMSQGKQSKFSTIALVLVFVLLLARLIKEYI